MGAASSVSPPSTQTVPPAPAPAAAPLTPGFQVLSLSAVSTSCSRLVPRCVPLDHLLWLPSGDLCLQPHSLGVPQPPWALSSPLWLWGPHHCLSVRPSATVPQPLCPSSSPPHCSEPVSQAPGCCTCSCPFRSPHYLPPPPPRVLTGTTGSRPGLWAGGGGSPPRTPAAEHPHSARHLQACQAPETPPQPGRGGGTWKGDQIPSNGQEMRA